MPSYSQYFASLSSYHHACACHRAPEYITGTLWMGCRYQNIKTPLGLALENGYTSRWLCIILLLN